MLIAILQYKYEYFYSTSIAWWRLEASYVPLMITNDSHWNHERLRAEESEQKKLKGLVKPVETKLYEKKRESKGRVIRRTLIDKFRKHSADEDEFETPKASMQKFKRNTYGPEGLEEKTSNILQTDIQSTHAMRQAPFTMLSQFVSFAEDDETDADDPVIRKNKKSNKHINNNNFFSDQLNYTSSFIENKTDDSLSGHTKTSVAAAATSHKSNLMLLKHMHDKNTLLHRIHAKEFGRKKHSDGAVGLTPKETSKVEKANRSFDSNGTSHRPIISILDNISKSTKKKKKHQSNDTHVDTSSEDMKTPLNENFTINQLSYAFSNKTDLMYKEDATSSRLVKATAPDKHDDKAPQGRNANVLWLEQGHFCSNETSPSKTTKSKGNRKAPASNNNFDPLNSLTASQKLSTAEKRLIYKETMDKLENDNRRKTKCPNGSSNKVNKNSFYANSFNKSNNNINMHLTNSNHNATSTEYNDNRFDDHNVVRSPSSPSIDSSCHLHNSPSFDSKPLCYNGRHAEPTDNRAYLSPSNTPTNEKSFTRTAGNNVFISPTQESLRYQFLYGDLQNNTHSTPSTEVLDLEASHTLTKNAFANNSVKNTKVFEPSNHSSAEAFSNQTSQKHRPLYTTPHNVHTSPTSHSEDTILLSQLPTRCNETLKFNKNSSQPSINHHASSPTKHNQSPLMAATALSKTRSFPPTAVSPPSHNVTSPASHKKHRVLPPTPSPPSTLPSGVSISK